MPKDHKQFRKADDVLASMLEHCRTEVARCELASMVTGVLKDREDLDDDLASKIAELGDVELRGKAFAEAAEVLQELLTIRRVDGVLGMRDPLRRLDPSVND